MPEYSEGENEGAKLCTYGNADCPKCNPPEPGPGSVFTAEHIEAAKKMWFDDVSAITGIDTLPPPVDRYTRFRDELQQVINSKSMENGSDTPDFMLAEFLTDALMSFDRLMQRRDSWYGGSHRQLKAQLEAEGAHTEAANAEIDRITKAAGQ